MVASYGKQRPGFAPEAVNAPHEGRSFHRRSPHEHSPYQIYHPGSGRGWWLKQGENTIGRGFDNDIVVTDLSVSRHHARIFVDGSHVYVKDSNSTNGIFVAGQRVKASILHLDCIFKLGKVELALVKPAIEDSGGRAWTVWD
jgi:pSer/pThr/pTyr-binding forkhead associated (FHA) protein